MGYEPWAMGLNSHPFRPLKGKPGPKCNCKRLDWVAVLPFRPARMTRSDGELEGGEAFGWKINLGGCLEKRM